MSEAAVKPLPTSYPKALHMAISGRIELERFVSGHYFTQIKTPAQDEYSQPSTFEVKSDGQLGAVGSVISGFVRVSGFVKSKPYKDRDTGQNKIFYDKTVLLEWVK